MLSGKGELEEAREVLVDAMDLAPDYAEAERMFHKIENDIAIREARAENLPPLQRLYRLLWLARKKLCVDDLQEALAMCDEALKIDPAYAGDVYFSMAMCHAEHAVVNELPYAAQNEAGRKKIELFERATEAYRQPGAKTTFPEATERRIARVETLIKWEKIAQEWRRRRIDVGILAPLE